MATAPSVLSSAAADYLRWSLIPDVGPRIFARLLERFGSARAALEAGPADLRAVDGISGSLANSITNARKDNLLDREIDLAARRGVRIICREDEEFPRLLGYVNDPPICLYVRGRLEPADAVAIAIVGSRRCTLYGREQAHRFGFALATRGITVVSGLARGVDGESHKGALASGGRTVAVLGNGLSRIYPPEHAELADRIAEQGAVVSELPMNTSPHKNNFKPRNRIIAGMSLGVLVVEAARRSGSLSTARLAAEYNREVFALPGRVDSDFSTGTNGLIRDQHAKLVTVADDIIDELGEIGAALLGEGTAPLDGDGPAEGMHLSDEERALYDQLDRQERSLEELCASTGQSVAQAAATLIRLQLKGLARQLPGSLFVRGRKP